MWYHKGQPFLTEIKQNEIKTGGKIMAIINLTKETFKQQISEADKPVIVDFWAPVYVLSKNRTGF